jgi:hypothetical protein
MSARLARSSPHGKHGGGSRGWRVAWAFSLAVTGFGCGGAHRGGAAEVAARYATAIEADQPKAAYDLLSDALRTQVTEADFMARWKSLRQELQAQAAQLRAVLGKGTEARAVVVYPSGFRARLACRGNEWRVEDEITSPLMTSTPAETLRAFVRAVEERDFDAAMRLLARPLRESVEKEIKDRVSKLRQALDREIEVSGGRARLQYDARSKVELVNEDGHWRIVTID